jgi:hypothetical protein
VRNRCLDHVRKRDLDTVSMTRDADDDAPELSLPDGGPGPAEMLLAGADAHAIRECVERLEGEVDRPSRWRSSRASRTASSRSTSRSRSARSSRGSAAGSSASRSASSAPTSPDDAMNLSRPDRARRLDLVAAEYALGTLPRRARARLDRVARDDAVVSRAMRDWERRIAVLADGAAPIQPPPRVWTSLARRLGFDDVSDVAPWWRRAGFLAAVRARELRRRVRAGRRRSRAGRAAGNGRRRARRAGTRARPCSRACRAASA